MEPCVYGLFKTFLCQLFPNPFQKKVWFENLYSIQMVFAIFYLLIWVYFDYNNRLLDKLRYLGELGLMWIAFVSKIPIEVDIWAGVEIHIPLDP